MKTQSPKKTKRKFYGEYIYKSQIKLESCYSIRVCNLETIVSILDGKRPKIPSYRPAQWRQNLKGNEDTWRKLYSVVKDHKDYKFRVEGIRLDLYTNNRQLYDNMNRTLADELIVCYEPPVGLAQKMLDSHDTVFVDKLPHDLYQFKVFLTPHKLPRNWEEREPIIEWIKERYPNIWSSESIREHIRHNNQNWDRRYLYVDTENTLLMLRLRSPELVGKVLKHVIK